MKIVKQMRAGAAVLGLVLGLTLGLGAGTPTQAETASVAGPARITVTGRAEVSAAPDMAVVTLGVTTEAKTAAQAMAENSRGLDRVFAALKTAGVAARDMQTSGLSLGPRWARPTEGAAQRVVGFTAANGVTVRVRKLDALGGVLDALVRAGANTINGLQFSVSNPGPLQDAVRAQAVKDAHRKAALMAEAAGAKLGRVLSISENGGGPRPLPMLRMAAPAGASTVPVSGGEVGFSADVTVTYALAQ
ncbi:hypothetical protein GCM10008024_31120 [Allgaiera indica]|uniref:SIMPL domain-containing protein n=1 Tax=Allgaiera indica TaxID=765699 RepID=A0AAN4UUJ7_9RHOB|nr:SIMPL domain-containing protein [Allgaiera indica]GHE04325.1 hypothetical protein GCM10008024_31120 [Allgaiera indica]SDX39879.1 hypothetical protein SAMN05444006_11539 [Allgaiera indica]